MSEITQADRFRAMLEARQRRNECTDAVCTFPFSGACLCFNTTLAQHRTQALEEAAQVAEFCWVETKHGLGYAQIEGTGKDAATAIRSLIPQDNTPSPANTKGDE